MGCRHGKQQAAAAVRHPDLEDWIEAANESFMTTVWKSTGTLGQPDAENVFVVITMYPGLLNLATPSGILAYIVNALKDTFPLTGYPCRSDMRYALASLVRKTGYTDILLDALLECELRTELGSLEPTHLDIPPVYTQHHEN